MRCIAIIGGGCCGTLLAARLMQDAPPEPLHLVLIESRAQLGRGVAYAEESAVHLLNVPAGRMSADAHDPLQFVRFAQRRNPAASAADFLPRSHYGDYLQQVLRQGIDAAPSRLRFQTMRARVTALHAIDIKGPFNLQLSDGGRLLADTVVLACGDPPSTPHACAIDAHAEHALAGSLRTLVLLGTGLTMVDIAVEAAARHPGVELHAISRHALLPQRQLNAVSVPLELDFEQHVRAVSSDPDGTPKARQLLRAFRHCLSAALRQGGDWRDAVNATRHMVPVLWQRLPPCERSRFLRHLRARWDVHRHRLPPAMSAQFDTLRASEQLQVHAGSITDLISVGSAIQVQWRARGSTSEQLLTVDRVVDCTGKLGRITQTRDPLLHGLLHSGLAIADEFGLGLRTEAGALIGANGSPSAHLFYLGPMLRADHWEATAVAELRAHAERLVQRLRDALSQEYRPAAVRRIA